MLITGDSASIGSLKFERISKVLKVDALDNEDVTKNLNVSVV